MRCAQSGRSSWWMDQVSVASVSAGAPVASWSRAVRRRTEPNRPPCRRCRSMLVSGCAWRWSSQRRRGRWPAATASEVHMAPTRAICAASNVVRLGADSRTANSTVLASVIRPSVRPAATTESLLVEVASLTFLALPVDVELGVAQARVGLDLPAVQHFVGADSERFARRDLTRARSDPPRPAETPPQTLTPQ